MWYRRVRVEEILEGNLVDGEPVCLAAGAEVVCELFRIWCLTLEQPSHTNNAERIRHPRHRRHHLVFVLVHLFYPAMPRNGPSRNDLNRQRTKP